MHVYLRRQKLRSCPLVRATIPGTRETVYRVSSLSGRTRIRRSFPIPCCCLRTVVPCRGTAIVRRPSSRPETSHASRPLPRGNPTISRRTRWASLNASWGFRDGNTFTRRWIERGLARCRGDRIVNRATIRRETRLSARKSCLAINFDRISLSAPRRLDLDRTPCWILVLDTRSGSRLTPNEPSTVENWTRIRARSGHESFTYDWSPSRRKTAMCLDEASLSKLTSREFSRRFDVDLSRYRQLCNRSTVSHLEPTPTDEIRAARASRKVGETIPSYDG